MPESENNKGGEKEEGKEKEERVLVSPNQMMEAGKKMMLEGRVPSTRKDWILLFNFFSANITKGLEEHICLVMKILYDVPLTQGEIIQICNYQMKLKD